MLKFLLLVCSMMILSQSLNIIYYSQLPVNRLTLFKALLSMNYLKNDLDSTFNTKLQNKIAYYIRTKLTENYLNDVSTELAQYNNVMIGNNGEIIGQKNLLIGDNNKVVGSQNWVFSQNFQGSIDRDIIIDNWQVEADKANQIIVDPRLAIRKW